MISYTKGNLLEAETEALVNTVNTVGVMGKGIALQFKEAFPQNFKRYKKACDNEEIAPGKLLVVKEHTTLGDKLIVNFPTKTEWYRKSSYKYIESGLKELANVIREHGIKSIAIPPLGCGHGGLQWPKVKALIEQYLEDVDVKIVVYEPNVAVKKILQKQEKKDVKLTPARAMLLYSLYAYESMGEASSLFAANKLAYFLQSMGENLRLKFVPHYYGPYSNQVGHVLYALNGKYLFGLEQKEATAFEVLKLNYETFDEVKEYVDTQLSPEQRQRLNSLIQLIAGFQSTLSLEVLSSVAFVLKDNPGWDKSKVYNAIQSWSKRKRDIINPKYVDVAYNRLSDYGQRLYIA